MRVISRALPKAGSPRIPGQRRPVPADAPLQSRPRWMRPVWFGAAVLAVSVFGWLAVSAALARHELQRMVADASLVRERISAGQPAQARAAMADLRTHADRAHRLLSNPVWSLAARLPVAGAPVRSFRGVAAVADDLSRDALGPMLDVVLDLNRIRTPDGRIDVARLTSAAPVVHRAAVALDRATHDLRVLPAGTGIAALDSARAKLLDKLGRAGKLSAQADSLAALAPAMLGAAGARDYLLVFENNAEARGTGGMPGAFAVAHVADGRISFSHLDSERVLDGAATNLDLGADYRGLYSGEGTTNLYSNANLSPHFPYAAAIWASMWKHKFARGVDGVIALDPTALGYLLRATGPAQLADGTTIAGDDVARLTEQAAYARFPGLDVAQDTARRKYLQDVEQAVVQRLTTAPPNGAALVGAVRAAVAEHRLLVWSARSAEQDRLSGTDLSGAVPVTKAPYVGLSIVNDGGNKLDYYLDRKLVWQRTGCGARRKVRVDITLTNNAPADLPPMVTSRSDAHPYPVKPGDNRLIVSYLATTGSTLDSAEVDGVRTMLGSGRLLEHPVVRLDLELPRGATRRIELVFTEPESARGAPIVLRQPLVRPFDVALVDDRCRSVG